MCVVCVQEELKPEDLVGSRLLKKKKPKEVCVFVCVCVCVCVCVWACMACFIAPSILLHLLHLHLTVPLSLGHSYFMFPSCFCRL